jgi:hypothetical protein
MKDNDGWRLVALTDDEFNHLCRFIGYGNLAAPTWFLGMEEAGAGGAALRTRVNFDSVEDCADAHLALGITKHHWGSRTIQSTWRGMCYVMLALDNRSKGREDIRRYQAEMLGRNTGSTLLVELMPIPRPRLGWWEYGGLIPQFSSAESYVYEVKPWRIQYIRNLYLQRRPSLVIAYGKKYWQDYASIFNGVEFQREGHFMIGRNRDSLIVFTDHFTSRTMNKQWDYLVEAIQRHR